MLERICNCSGWGGTFENETDFVFDKGILKEVKEFRNTVVSSPYTVSQKVIEFFKSNINYKDLPPLKERIRVITKITSVDKNGKISNVEIIRGYNDAYDKEAIRVVKSIPKWEYVERRGKIINRGWALPITFEPQDSVRSN